VFNDFNSLFGNNDFNVDINVDPAINEFSNSMIDLLQNYLGINQKINASLYKEIQLAMNSFRLKIKDTTERALIQTKEAMAAVRPRGQSDKDPESWGGWWDETREQIGREADHFGGSGITVGVVFVILDNIISAIETIYEVVTTQVVIENDTAVETVNIDVNNLIENSESQIKENEAQILPETGSILSKLGLDLEKLMQATLNQWLLQQNRNLDKHILDFMVIF